MKKLEAGIDHRFTVQVTTGNVGVAGQDVLLNLQRLSDNKWWTGVKWDTPETDLDCSETGSTYPGEYYYDLAGAEIEDGVIYKEQFKITSGIYTFNSVDESYAEYDVDKLALTYDFSTYTKAVILWYAADRPFGGTTPIYWTYVYNSIGGRPTISEQICTKDRVLRWSEAEPV